MEKMCFLILAHSDPKQLKRLVYSLDYPQFDIFIHIDKKTDISLFDFDKYDLKYSHLYILKNRVKVYWGDYSNMQAFLRLYKKALDTDNYIRFVMLSGVDYPISSNKNIYDTLSDLNKEFICGNPITDKELHKVSFHYFFKYKYLNSFCSKLRKLFNVKVIESKRSFILSDGRELIVFFAPVWHALSKPCVEYLLNTINKFPEIEEFFKYAYAPEELLIPTVVFNSHFKERTIKSDYPENTHFNEKTALHYLNYEPVMEVFDENKFDDIIASNKLFFRKAASGKSDKLINLIDKRRDIST